ncbi:MAG: ABC transporter permease subunit [Endomicrobium sp.]|nr:ABC transporter permease subunit [Endomicrobium sp.]
MKIFTTSNKVKKEYILAIIFWIVVWEIGSVIVGQEILLVSPIYAIKKLFELSMDLVFWESIFYSFSKIIFGFLCAVLVGILMAIVVSNNRKIRILIEPLILVIQSIPVASFIILCLIWISSENLSIIISFLMVLPIIFRNTLTGIESVGKDLQDMCKVFNVKKTKMVRYVYMSEVITHFRSACSVSLGLCWKSGIAAEVIGMPKNSIGENLYKAKIYLNTPELFAWTIVIVIISICFQKFFLKLIDIIINRLEMN